MPTPRLLILCLAVLSNGSLVAQKDGRMTTAAPVKNYSIVFFSEEGYQRVRVQGETAEVQDPTKVRLGGMTLTEYTGDADRTIESVLTAPIAIVEPETEIVSGPDSVKLVRSDLELSGEDWTYEKEAKRVHIRRNAKLIFNAGFTDLLK